MSHENADCGRHGFQPLCLINGEETDTCAVCGSHRSNDLHTPLVEKLLARADRFCPKEWSASAYWYGSGGGRQHRLDSELLREAAAVIAHIDRS